MNLHEGQTLWFVGDSHVRRWSSHKSPRHVTVTKVGRRWATLSNGFRIDKDTLQADGGRYSSPGRCYLSEASYQEEQARANLWHEVRNTVLNRWRPPSSLTTAEIQQLILTLKDESPEARPERRH